MFHGQGFSKSCTLLAVLCGKFVDRKPQEAKKQIGYPFPKLPSSGRLEVHTLKNPPVDKFVEVQKSLSPNFLFIQGEQLENEEEIGSLVWPGADLSDPSSLSSLISTQLPTIVYLEFPNAQKVADALQAKGVPYVIYWRNGFSSYAASHFRQAFMLVVQSSCSHTWDAFQLAHASYRLYCTRSNNAVKSQKNESKLGPCLLGERPKINITLPEKVPIEEGSPSDSLPAIKIYDDEINMKFLVCGAPCTLDSSILGSLEDGLNALLNIEIRGSKLHNRVSAVPPPLQAGNFSRGVITMRCDLTTCSSAHISLLVSGSAQTCFDDQLLENHIKNEIIENCHLVHAWPTPEQISQCSSEPRKSSSIACGSPVFEVCMRVPTWASQVLKQLAPETSYRTLVSLGVASAQGTSVASFEEEDAHRLLFFCTRQDLNGQEGIRLPVWLKPALPKKRAMPDHDVKYKTSSVLDGNARIEGSNTSPQSSSRKKVKIAAMKPIPHVRQHKMLPFSAVHNVGIPEGSHLKPHMPVPPPPRPLPPAPTAHKKTSSNSFHAQQIISLNPLPLKKHGCNRSPIQACSEEEFLRDVMEFLILRGHSRLVPQGGLSEFPDAILNAKRLDLYNLYREVVTRGGFHVGNGINWKGQVFSKMRNHTVTNRMTGVGNTLKRHYETYLLEYELAHDDVDGEYCLLCHSSAPGDWVNCGLCGEWAHFGCDRRQGLGAFKDYAKTDGLEYVCPHCSVTNYRRKSPNVANGFSQGSAAPLLRHM